MNSKRRFRPGAFLAVQLVIVAAFAASYGVASLETRQTLRQAVSAGSRRPAVHVESHEPLHVVPLYDDPGVVGDEELAAVLEKLLPRFSREELSPNNVEHALRTWGVEATFEDPALMSGVEMRDFLLDHGRYAGSWGRDVPPLLQPRPQGVAVRWGREQGASMHHDHLLACLTEAGVPLNQQVYPPGRRKAVLNSILQQALRDVRLEEREVEWSVMAFALWLPPTKRWTTGDGRRMSFDLLAKRLMRGHRRFGTCLGTHRIYSLMLLLRVDDRMRAEASPEARDGLLSDSIRQSVYLSLAEVRDLIQASQFDDGHWPSNWYDGADARISPRDDQEFEQVIATGHHLEWLAIAPPELLPPREQIHKAADWVIGSALQQPDDRIRQMYTYYSHVASALALWRKTRPFDFWERWQRSHPREKAD